MSKSIIAVCPACKYEFLFKTNAKRPRPHCPECHHWFYTQDNDTQNTQIKQSTQKQPSKRDSSTQQLSTFNEGFIAMTDPEKVVNTYRMVLSSNDASIRERLEACRGLTDYLLKTDQLESTTQMDEKEVIDRFKRKSTQTLVNLLSKSLQEE